MFASFIACGPPPQPSPAETPPARPSPLTVERTPTGAIFFDPAYHGADDVRVEAEQIIRQIPPPPDGRETTRDTVAVPSDTTWIFVKGYRVQVFVSTTREQAETQAEIARLRFPQDSVYIVFEAPWQKVRIGDFRTVQEARAKADEAKAKGYRDPFWLYTDVRVVRRPGDKPSQER